MIRSMLLFLFYHLCVFAVIYAYYTLFVSNPLKNHHKHQEGDFREIQKVILPHLVGCVGSFFLNIFGLSRIFEQLRGWLMEHYFRC